MYVCMVMVVCREGRWKGVVSVVSVGAERERDVHCVCVCKCAVGRVQWRTTPLTMVGVGSRKGEGGKGNEIHCVPKRV